MALDACFLQFIARDLQHLVGAQVDKVYQPSRDEILLHLRGKEKGRLMISSSPNSARIHLTSRSVENPKVPLPFAWFCANIYRAPGFKRFTPPPLSVSSF
ncbi:MAG: NFACT family protein [Clostridia bacterium]|nr:NFACT family protein [Clostridia bacterium]